MLQWKDLIFSIWIIVYQLTLLLVIFYGSPRITDRWLVIIWQVPGCTVGPCRGVGVSAFKETPTSTVENMTGEMKLVRKIATSAGGINWLDRLVGRVFLQQKNLIGSQFSFKRSGSGSACDWFPWAYYLQLPVAWLTPNFHNRILAGSRFHGSEETQKIVQSPS